MKKTNEDRSYILTVHSEWVWEEHPKGATVAYKEGELPNIA
jgi:hypothetical protein